MNRYLKTFGLLAVAIIIYGAGFWHGNYFQKELLLGNIPAGVEENRPSEFKKIDLSNFWKVWNILESKYVGADKIDRQNLLYGAMHGLVGALGDPFSVYFEPKENARFNQDISGQFQGIGIEIGMRKGILTVIAPLKGTPAYKAGLKSGDSILAIDDKMTGGLMLDEAVDKIRGPKGTKVKLTILRDEFDKPKDFEIRRDVIIIKSVEVEMLPGNIGKIAIYNFNENSLREFISAANSVKSARAIIIDLRDNPGGYLESAVEITGWFVKKGSVVVKEQLMGGKNGETFRTSGNELFLNQPVVILINKGSASASEILAGALRDLRKTPLVGETTFGKGSVQQVFSLGDGSSIKLTIARWLTPNGSQINDVGLKPDYEVKLPDNYKEGDKDPQLEKALEILI